MKYSTVFFRKGIKLSHKFILHLERKYQVEIGDGDYFINIYTTDNNKINSIKNDLSRLTKD